MLRALLPIRDTASEWDHNSISRWLVNIMDETYVDNHYKYYPLAHRRPHMGREDIEQWLRENGPEWYRIFTDGVGFPTEEDAILFALAFA